MLQLNQGLRRLNLTFSWNRLGPEDIVVVGPAGKKSIWASSRELVVICRARVHISDVFATQSRPHSRGTTPLVAPICCCVRKESSDNNLYAICFLSYVKWMLSCCDDDDEDDDCFDSLLPCLVVSDFRCRLRRRRRRRRRSSTLFCRTTGGGGGGGENPVCWAKTVLLSQTGMF